MMELREKIQHEANQWFRRNKDNIIQREESYGAQLIGDFFANFLQIYHKEMKLMEIGSCYGFNLHYWNQRLGIDCFGIEPSDEAVEFGQRKFDWGGAPETRNIGFASL